MPVYHYQGIERFSWFFRSPNVCATFLAVAIIVCIGLYFQCRRSSCRWGTVLSWLFAALAGCGVIFLALTYSRCGMVALLIGLAAMWNILKSRTILGFLLLAVGFSLLVEGGVSRYKSIVDFAGDASLRNRIFLWRGAAGMIAESPWRGTKNAGNYYHAWRQPLWFQDEYRTMINDPLTLGADYGIWAVMLYFLLLVLLVWNSCKYVHSKLPYAEAVAGLSAGVITYAVSACFSTMVEHVPLMTLLGLPLFSLIVILTHAFVKRRLSFRWRDILGPIAISGFLCMMIYLFGVFENASLPICWKVDARNYTGTPSWLIHVWPHQPIRGRILVFTDSPDSMLASQIQPAIRAILRPLALAGFDVYSIGIDSGFDGKETALATLREMLAFCNQTMPFAILGCGTGAKAALLVSGEVTSSEVNLVAAVDSPAYWPFEDLSPAEVIHRYSGRIMLLASPARQDDAYELADIRNQHGLETVCVELSSQPDIASANIVAQFLSELIQQQQLATPQGEMFYRPSVLSN